jgi:hypothetical protein
MDSNTTADAVRVIAARVALDEASRKRYNAQRPVFDLPRNEAECAVTESALGDAQSAYIAARRVARHIDPLDVLSVGHEQAVIADRGTGFMDEALVGARCDAVWSAAMAVARELRAEGM